jgi:hypothetical protein
MRNRYPVKSYKFVLKIFLPVSLLFFLLIACGEKSGLKGLVINQEFGDRILTDNLVTELKAKFITTPAFSPLDKGARLVVELDWQGKILCREELKPDFPPDLWQPERVYEARKFLFIPSFLNRFDPEKVAGAKVNLLLLLEGAGSREPLILLSRKLKILPCPEEVPDVVYLDGWVMVRSNQRETGPQGYELWTRPEAVCLLKNPGKTARLMIIGESSLEENTVSIFIDGSQLDEFQIGAEEFQKIYTVEVPDPAKQPEIKLIISCDKFIKLSRINPALNDERAVSLRIKKIYFRQVPSLP